MKASRHLLLRFIAFVTLALASVSPAAERVALVVGNGAYTQARALKNPTRDAAAVAGTLRDAGFQVTVVNDATVEAFFEGLETFKKAATGAEVALFFYAGHGMEVDGKNYLLPVDAALESSAQLRTQTVPLETVLGDLDAARAVAKLVILDCCRDNPLSRSWMASRSSGTGGLGAIADGTVPPATMIMYASAPGQVALDGTGANSPFTEALVAHLAQPGLSAFDTFLGVSDVVARTTGEKQVPWIKFDGAGRAFRLFTLGRGPVGATPPPVVAMRPTVPSVPSIPSGVSSLEGTRGGEVRTFGGIEMVWCPPGEFTMGSPLAEEGRFDDEKQVQVTLRRGYWLAKTECTQGQWQTVMGSSVSQQKAKVNSDGDATGMGSRQPMYFVSWEDAVEFCEKLNRESPAGAGWKWSLPSEAQWEYACRAGTTGPYAGELNKLAWYGDNADGTTHEVGTKAANEWGLHDMHGNVWEWCADWYGETLPGGTNPSGPAEGVGRVHRGGSWFDYAARCRAAYRYRDVPGYRDYFLGFRPALVPSDP
jgi:hypothetical protein